MPLALEPSLVFAGQSICFLLDVLTYSAYTLFDSATYPIASMAASTSPWRHEPPSRAAASSSPLLWI